MDVMHALRGGQGVSRSQKDAKSLREVPTPSRLVRVFETPLEDGLYGSIRLNTQPFQIVLNSKVLTPRKQVSLTHEMLHAFMELHKMHSFPHDKLHDLAVFIQEQVLPVLVAHSDDASKRGVKVDSLLTNPRRVLPNVTFAGQDRADGSKPDRSRARACDCEGRCDCA